MLPITFADTFAPERTYLSILLKFFKTHKKYMDKMAISEETGIPQGASTGKVVPHIKYMLGMNLIESDDKWYKLTPFGKAVYEMDKSLTENISAWACHAFMCDNEDGAILYNRAFKILKSGRPLTESDFENTLTQEFDKKDSGRYLSSFISYYTKPTSFAKANILSLEDGVYTFNSAPIKRTFLPMYGAFVCHYLYKYFPDKAQVSSTDFINTTGFCDWFGIKGSDFKMLLEQLAGAGYIKLLNLVDPPVISPIMEEEDCWDNLYSNLI